MTQLFSLVFIFSVLFIFTSLEANPMNTYDESVPDNTTTWTLSTLKPSMSAETSPSYYTLYCPASTNETIPVNSTDLSSQRHQNIQEALCFFIKLLTVVGISIPSGLGIAILVPIALIIALGIVGFTTCGIIPGSCAACCHSRIGDVERDSLFARSQSTGANSFDWLLGIYKSSLFILIWISASVTVAYLIWDKY